MVTWANFHYLDFTLNWVQHVQAANISAYLVGAMDDELLEALLERGINCFGMQSGLSIEDFGWGSKQFHKMVCTLFTGPPVWTQPMYEGKKSKEYTSRRQFKEKLSVIPSCPSSHV